MTISARSRVSWLVRIVPLYPRCPSHRRLALPFARQLGEFENSRDYRKLEIGWPLASRPVSLLIHTDDSSLDEMWAEWTACPNPFYGLCGP